jgi:hypothetical protein
MRHALALAAVVVVALLSCTGTPARSDEAPDRWAQPRAALIDTIARRGIRDERVLAAMLRVPRHEFVPSELRAHAYDDRALQIGFDQTISQPFVVAAMTEAARIAATGTLAGPRRCRSTRSS